MQQKMRFTLIKIKNQQYIQFVKVISYLKFGFNALFCNLQSSNILQSQNINNNHHLIVKQYHNNKTQPNKNTKNNKRKYYDVYGFSKSLLQINNLKNQIQDQIKLFNGLNNKIISPIIDRIDDKDMFYLVSEVYQYSLKELVEMREGLTEYEVIYFVMEIFQIFSYYKSREIYLQKVQLSSFYLNNDMKIIIPFSIFLNVINNKPIIKRLPFRKQFKNLNNCPDLFQSELNNKKIIQNEQKNKINQKNNKLSQQQQININLINSWNLGILIYELFENNKPFSINCELIAQSGNVPLKYLNQQIINKKLYQINFKQTSSCQAQQLIRKLLEIDPKKRLNLPLIMIQPLFKKFQQIPHILPSTILTCPPSQEFKQSFQQKFSTKQSLLKQSEIQKVNILSKRPQRNLQSRGWMKSQSSKILENNRSQSIKKQNELLKNHENVNNDSQEKLDPSINQQDSTPISPKVFSPIYQTQKYIKDSERNLSENKVYIQQFVDISHIYGFGYQLNTGMLCFVFNDETEFYYPDASRKNLVYINEKKIRITYSSEKLPEEDELKKKIYILEGYSKTMKKYKNQSLTNQKVVTVLKYAKTKHACLFYLSNDTIQLFFNDKISFLMTKNIFYILGKNNDKYEKYDFKNQTSELKTRRNYVISMADKIFGWKKDKLLDQELFEFNGTGKHIENEQKKLKDNGNGKKKYVNILGELDNQGKNEKHSVNFNVKDKQINQQSDLEDQGHHHNFKKKKSNSNKKIKFKQNTKPIVEKVELQAKKEQSMIDIILSAEQQQHSS